MPQYRYRAFAANGVPKTGAISAASRGAALDILSRRGELPVGLTEDTVSETLRWWQRDVFEPATLTTARLAAFTRELAGLAKAELPIDEALRVIAAQPTISPRLTRIVVDLLERVREGQSFSQALAAQGPAFPEFYCRLVRAGEASGSLAPVFEDLAQYLERSAEIKANIKSSLIYPAVLVVAALAAGGIIAGVLLPAILPVFEDAHVAPPFMLRAVAGLHHLVVNNWIVLAIAACSGFAAIMGALRSETVRRTIDHLALKLPLAGRLIQESETARFARTFGTLVRNGVPVLDATQIAGAVLSNRAFSDAARQACEEIRQGRPLSHPLSRCGLFPDLFLRLAVVGEETGHLDAMHLRAAEFYEGSRQRLMQRLTTLITPVMTLLIGGLVGSLIISVMSAILSMNELALQ